MSENPWVGGKNPNKQIITCHCQQICCIGLNMIDIFDRVLLGMGNFQPFITAGLLYEWNVLVRLILWNQ